MEPLSIIPGAKKTLSALATLYNGCKAINDRFVVKKIEKFSEKPFDENVVKNFIEEIDISRWEEIQDSVIHLLTHAETVVKAVYERNLVEALLTKKITDDEFWKMNFALQHLYTLDIGDLVHLYSGESCSEDKKRNFAFYGLLKDKGITSFASNALTIGQHYALNDFGKKFVDAVKG